MTSRHLQDLTAPQAAKQIKQNSIIIQPLGAVEQHGPHLPLSVDFVIAQETANRVVSDFGEELNLWKLPTLAVTKSNEHAAFAGTIWLRAETLLAVLDDIAGCVAKTGAQKLVFLNAHGGNSALLNVACRDIRLKHGLQTFLMHPFMPQDSSKNTTDENTVAETREFEIHGGIEETSLMLHLRPELVDMDEAVPNIPTKLKEYKHIGFGKSVSFGWLSDDFGKLGLIGDPTGATAEHGKELFETVTTTLGEQLKEIAKFSFM